MTTLDQFGLSLTGRIHISTVIDIIGFNQS
jgi:hypothetical protein